MEIFSIILAIIPTLLFIFYASKYIRSTTPLEAPLPPGKLGLPILGETMNFISNVMSSTPEKFIRDRITRHGSSTFKTSLLGHPMVVMYGAAGNKFVFANEGKLVRVWFPKSIQTLFSTSENRVSVGTQSKELRADDLAQFLEPDGLQKYVGIMDYMARKHLKAKWHGQQQVMVYPMAEEYTFALACRLFLSTEDADLIAKLTGPIATFSSGLFALPINLPWTQFGRAMRVSNVIMKQLMTIIRKRRQELSLVVDKDLDILSHMLLRHDEDGNYMNDVKMAFRVMGIIIASHANSSIVISMLFKHLGEDPELYHKVFQEQIEIARNKADGELLNWNDIMKMKYSWNVALEAMRLYPPVQLIFRDVISDFTYSDHHVPKGWKLLVGIHAMHRDPKYFPNPEKFDPSRFKEGGPLPYTFLPFGGGSRICPGRNYARMEILAFLHNVVKSFKWENIIPDEKIVLYPTPRPAKGLPIRLHPR